MQTKLVFLKTDEDFEQFRRSKLFSSSNLRMRVRYNTNQNLIRFGFIVPKKVLSKVTDRNVVKRRLKTIFQKHLKNIKPADLLCFPQKSALKTKFQDLESEIIKLLSAARLWKQSEK